MPKKRKTLEVDTEVGSVMGKRAVGIGAIVNGKGTGKRKMKTKIRTLIGDDDAVLIGAVDRGRSRKKS